jgi:prophage antirepressor-like protein
MENNQFNISEWFNQLPIRIVGSVEFPMFYASDIGAVLETKNIRQVTANYDEVDVVTPEQRKQYNIKTYKMRKDKMVENSKIILLTEAGVYRLIMNSRSARAKEFRQFIVKIIKDIRMSEITKLKVIAETATMESGNKEQIAKLTGELKNMQTQLQEYKKIITIIYVFEADISNVDPYKMVIDGDLDKYFMKHYDCDTNGTKLYKYTTNALLDDYNQYKLVNKIYTSDPDSFFSYVDNFQDQILITVPKSKYNYKYICDLPSDEIDLSIVDDRAQIL